jgi:outer membrane lipoprotein carrier protein
MIQYIFAFLIAVTSINSCADGLKDLENFLTSTRSGRASFTQTVTAPARSGEAAPRAKVSSGTFEFSRPDRFRFDYRKPFEQVIVADGTTLWLYDVDLNQVTSRSQAQVLGSTPAALVASSASLVKLAEVFEFKAAPDADGLSWAQATPRQRDGQIRRVSVGFAQGQLAVLDMEDSFGQRSTVRFEGFKANVVLPPDAFKFTPPAGADVLRP